jgi:hypothetical protein
VGNRTRAHGDESNPLEISVSSAMKGEPGLCHRAYSIRGSTPLFVRGSPVTETCVKRGSNRGQGPIRFLLLYRGSSPFTHCATSAGHCATSAGDCANSAGHLHVGQDYPHVRRELSICLESNTYCSERITCIQWKITCMWERITHMQVEDYLPVWRVTPIYEERIT